MPRARAPASMRQRLSAPLRGRPFRGPSGQAVLSALGAGAREEWRQDGLDAIGGLAARAGGLPAQVLVDGLAGLERLTTGFATELIERHIRLRFGVLIAPTRSGSRLGTCPAPLSLSSVDNPRRRTLVVDDSEEV